MLAQNCIYADFRKILSQNCEEITSSLCNNNPAVIAPNSYKFRPTTLPYSYKVSYDNFMIVRKDLRRS